MGVVSYDFTGYNFLITGASSGIGKQIASELALNGATVLAVARNTERLQKLMDTYPDNIVSFATDICVDNLAIPLTDFVNKYGKLNGFVHAAGISGLTPLKSYDKEVAHQIMNTSFWAGVDILQVCNKNAYAKKGASNVLFSSVAASTGEKGMFAYAAAKAAIQVAVKSFAKEIALSKRRINTISPGWVESEMTLKSTLMGTSTNAIEHHLLGVGSPADISGVVMFLLSDRASWITGTNIVVDGGFLAK